jgi:hypothetical protein
MLHRTDINLGESLYLPPIATVSLYRPESIRALHIGGMIEPIYLAIGQTQISHMLGIGDCGISSLD